MSCARGSRGCKTSKFICSISCQLAGTNFEEGKEILNKSNLKILSASDLNDAAKKLLRQ